MKKKMSCWERRRATCTIFMRMQKQITMLENCIDSNCTYAMPPHHLLAIPLLGIKQTEIYFCISQWEGFPGGSEVKASASNTGDLGSIPGSGRSPGEGNGNPLQYSCLENPMDGGAWWATVHGVAKSRTRLSYLTLNYTDFLYPQIVNIYISSVE